MNIRRHVRLNGPILVAILILAMARLAAAQQDDTYDCLNGASTVVKLSGDQQYQQYRPSKWTAGTVFDARGATWLQQVQPTLIRDYPIILGAKYNETPWPQMCFSGGIIKGTNNLDATWCKMKTPNNSAFCFGALNSTIDGVRIHNTGDGVRPVGASNGFVIKNCWLSYIRDDAIEDDNMAGGTIDDCLIDGCYAGFSCSNTDATANTSSLVVKIQNCLIRLEAEPGPRQVGGACPADQYGHAGFFKWSGFNSSGNLSIAPQIELHDNVFYTDGKMVPTSVDMGLPPGKLTACSNNVMIWTGQGDFPGELDLAKFPKGFTIVRDSNVWADAKQDWINTHPEVPRLPGDPSSLVTSATGNLRTQEVPANPAIRIPFSARVRLYGLDGRYIGTANGSELAPMRHRLAGAYVVELTGERGMRTARVVGTGLVRRY